MRYTISSMVNVEVFKQGNFPVNSAKIKKTIKDTLRLQGLVSDFEVSVAIVGETKMEELVKEYYKDDPKGEYIHPILTFPTNEMRGEFVLPKGQVQDLGEIVISYPAAVMDAKDRGVLVEKVVLELAEHGALHLAGVHH